MKVHIHLKNQSEPIELSPVKNAYQKGDFYCVMLPSRVVHKYPMADLFRAVEFPEGQEPEPLAAVEDLPANRPA